ncbi:MAG: sugar transferase [Lachnospiraceae bacterium]|nr:sugar transferase [Lachnospiraceae bacterium]
MDIKRKRGIYEKCIKRILDIICSLLIIVLFSWLYLIIALLVRINMGSPVIFRQARPGKINPKTDKEKIFYLYKFRTMTDAKDENGELLPDADRLTSLGAWLRESSMDEIPEIFNILKGDMSLIGPRPLLVQYLPYYTENERHRHDVRPGLSGLAQVSGRNLVKWDERLALDVKYVENITFLEDVKIFLQTIGKVFKREDVAADPESVDEGYLDEIRKNGIV